MNRIGLMVSAICVAILSVFSRLEVHAQLVNSDSLFRLVQEARADSTKLRLLKGYASLTSRSDPRRAFEFSASGIRLATKLRDSASLAIFLKENGVAHITLGNRDSAVWYWFQSIELLERLKAERELANAYNDLARFYRRTEPDRAIPLYDKAMLLFKKLNDEGGQSMIWNESGVAFENKGELAEAERRYNTSLSICKRLKDSVGIGYALSFLGGVKAAQKQYQEAESLSLEVVAIRQALRDSFGLAIAYTNLGELYNLTGKYKEAQQFFEQSNALANRISFLDIMAHNYGQLSLAAEKSGMYREAFEYKQREATLKDSLFQVAKNKQVEELSARYETAEKERKIQEQKFDLVRKNYLLLILGLLLVLVMGGGFWYYKRRQEMAKRALETERQRQQEAATKAVMEAEENERRRIAAELHDGVGQLMSAARMNLSAFESTVTTLESAQRGQLEKIVSLVDEGCREVRSVSHSMIPNALLKRGMAAAIRDFIEKIDSKVLKVNLHVEGLQTGIDATAESMLYRVIQECINNVIKHSGANVMDIAIINDADGISVTIEDNGRGFDVTTMQAQASGIGMRNMLSRIQFLKGTIEWDSAPGKGTLVAINVPLGQ